MKYGAFRFQLSPKAIQWHLEKWWENVDFIGGFCEFVNFTHSPSRGPSPSRSQLGISSLGESARRSWGPRIAGCCRWWRKRFTAPTCRSSWEQRGHGWGKGAPSYGAVKNPSQIIQNCSSLLLKPIETYWNLCGSTLWYPVSAWGLGFFRGVIRVGKLSSEHWWIADGIYDIHNTQWVSNDSECTLNNHEYMMDG